MSYQPKFRPSEVVRDNGPLCVDCGHLLQDHTGSGSCEASIWTEGGMIFCPCIDGRAPWQPFPPACRRGVIGDLCRCWQCRGRSGPNSDESAAIRDASLVDRAITYGQRMDPNLKVEHE